MAVTVKDLERIRQEGLKALKEKLGLVGMIKFIQMYSAGEGDYTEERKEKLVSLKEEDLQKYLLDKFTEINLNFAIFDKNYQIC